MIPSRAFDTLRGRKAQASTRFHFSFPLKVRRLMVNPGVPDEVQMEKMLQVETCGLPTPPQLDMQAIEFAEHLALVPALPDIAGYQIARALRNLKPHLHPHGSFGQRSQEGFEQTLEAIPSLIARVIRLNTSNLIASHQRPVDLHRNVFKQVPDAKLLAQRGRAHRLFVSFDR